MVGGIKVNTGQYAFNSTFAATTLDAITTNAVSAITLTSDADNAGTIYAGGTSISGSGATVNTGDGIPILPGKSLDFGQIAPGGGETYGEYDLATLKVACSTTAGTLYATYLTYTTQ